MSAATLGRLLLATRERLMKAGVLDAALDARLIVEHFSGTERIDALRRPDMALTPEATASVENAVARRLAGEPVHRILGWREFFGLRIGLSPATLEPRPDTEILVEMMLPFIREATARTGECRILDLGTGSGAIALALLSQAPGAVAIGSDLSAEALDTAAANAAALGFAARFTTVQSNWLRDISGKFHAIVSNPPYVLSRMMAKLPREVRGFDPELSLDGGEDGMDPYRAIAEGVGEFLLPGGVVGVETGYDQREEVTAIFEARGFRLAGSSKDLAGNDRAIAFRA